MITLLIDASALRISSCMRRMYLNTVGGYTPKVNTNDMEFGSAFHIFRSHWRNTGNLPEATGLAIEYFRDKKMIVKFNKQYLTLGFLASAIVQYSQEYEHDNFLRLEEDTREIRIAIPYYVDDEVEVILCATMDEIGQKVNGPYGILDTKTTSMYEVRSYLNGYELSTQLYTYRFILRKMAEEFPDSIYAEIDKKSVFCQIDGVFYSANDIKLVRSDEFYYSDKQLRDFEVMLRRQVMRLVEEAKLFTSTYMPLPEGIINSSCETLYGPCKYSGVCAAPDDVSAREILEYSFVQKTYNPLLFGSNEKETDHSI